MTFRTIFYEVVMPIVCESGVLWQTDTITPVHEHFICTHFKQKILINIERIQSLYPRPDTVTYVLFLPDNELHDLGLLFINYELVCIGYHTVYLGESTPINDLARVNSIFDEIVFVSYFTVQPEHNKINNYIEEIDTKLLQDNDNKALLLGRQLQHYDPTRLPEKIEIYQSITDLVKDL
jgi:methanogenic corrinoid protein MtbC1